MTIKNVKLARSIWLFDLQDLNPGGKAIVQKVFDWIKERYNFAIAPDLRTLLAAGRANGPLSTGAVFEEGHFHVREDVFIEISKLTLYNDGIVIDTPSSTMDGDQFAKDLLESAAREFSLAYDAETVRKRIYLSEMVVRSDISLDLINPRLAAFAKRISEALSDDTKPEFRVAGLHFWSEANDAGTHRMFRLERQTGKAFAERRYFSQAPLQTSEHSELLQELEQILMESQAGS